MLFMKVKNNRGSTLLLVIIVFALLLIFGMAALTLSANANRNSVTDWQSQQAYFTARSAVLAAVDYFVAAPDAQELLESLDGKQSNETNNPKLGQYNLSVDKLDETHYGLASTAVVDGQERTVSVILSVEGGSSAFPFGQNLVTATRFNDVESAIDGGAQIHGDLMINKTARLPAGVNIFGNLYVDGPVTITGGPNVKKENGEGGNIYANDDLTLNGVSVTVEGDIYCAEDLVATGGRINTLAQSLILVGGNMGGSGFSINTPQNIVVGRNGDFRNCTIRTQLGNIYFGGRNTVYQNDSTFNNLNVFEGYSLTGNGYEMPNMNYGEEMESLRDLVDITGYEAFVDTFKDTMVNIDGEWESSCTVSQSGTLNSVSRFNGTLNVDTTEGDVHWYITQNSIAANVLKTCDVKITGSGENQLIIHLAPGVTFNTLSYKSLGITGSATAVDRNTKPRVCIIAPYGENPSRRNSIVLGGSAKLAAYIIMPFGDFTINGGALFTGNMIVGSSQLVSGAKLYYQEPNYPNEYPWLGAISVSGDGSGGHAGGGVSLAGVYTTRGAEEQP